MYPQAPGEVAGMWGGGVHISGLKTTPLTTSMSELA